MKKEGTIINLVIFIALVVAAITPNFAQNLEKSTKSTGQKTTISSAGNSWKKLDTQPIKDTQNRASAYLLVLNKTDNTLVMVEPSTSKIAARIQVGEGPHEVAVSKDGRTAYVANYGGQTPGNSLSVVDLAARKETKRVPLGGLLRPHGIVQVGGKIYFTAELNRVVARYDPAKDQVDWVMGTGQSITHMLAATPDEKRLYTANIYSDTVTMIALGAPPVAASIAQISVGKQPEAIEVSPDGREVWVGQNGDGFISIIDTATNKVKETIKAGEMPIRIRFTPDGKRVLVTDAKAGALIIFDAATRKELKSLKIEGTPVGVLVEPAGKRAFVAAMTANKIVVINLENSTLAGEIETGAGPDGMAWAISGATN